MRPCVSATLRLWFEHAVYVHPRPPRLLRSCQRQGPALRAGHPAFPLLMPSEIFKRCISVRERNGLTGRVALYDSCCGAACQLAALGFLHHSLIRAIITSDINPEIIPRAERIHGVLSASGLDTAGRNWQRRSANSAMHPTRKHWPRPEDCATVLLRGPISSRSRCPCQPPMPWRTPAPSASQSQHRSISISRMFRTARIKNGGLHPQSRSIGRMLQNLLPLLHPGRLVAIASDKHRKAAHDRNGRIERLQSGTAVILCPKP